MVTREMDRKQLDAEAFSQSEASVRLEGIDPTAYPSYLALKARVMDGEITPQEAVTLLLDQHKKSHTTAA